MNQGGRPKTIHITKMVVQSLPLVAGACRERAEQARIFASRLLEPSAKKDMLFVAAAYETLAKLKISLERDLELRTVSETMIESAKLEIGRNWRWVG